MRYVELWMTSIQVIMAIRQYAIRQYRADARKFRPGAHARPALDAKN